MARRKEAAPPPDNVVPIHVGRRRSVLGEAAKPKVDPVEKARERSEASATDSLEKALKAKTPELRAKHARAGLARTRDVETQALLLRQLYLGELESGQFTRARQVAEQIIELGPMPDVARHDAARACQAEGDFPAAIEHLREAGEIAPKERRAFHLSALGGLLYAIGRGEEAIAPLERALSSGEDGGAPAPLLRGQLALARGHETELDLAYRELVDHPSGEGYGRFVLGELAFQLGDRRRAQLHLDAFLARTRRSRPAARAGLAPEIARATATLGRIVWN
ncbi:MAG: tetratricopeptide repeat protein [Polyangiales bacterium]